MNIEPEKKYERALPHHSAKHDFQKTARENFDKVAQVGPKHTLSGIPRENVIKFFQELKRNNWNANKAAEILHPNVHFLTARNYGRWYLGLLDPYKVFLPRNRWEKSTFMEVMKQEIYSPKSPEEGQRVFEALFEKYGANGMKSALLAVQELHPDVSEWKGSEKAKRTGLLKKARKYLANSNYTFDLITALEARGVDANKLADKVLELLNAKRKRSIRIKGDLVEETTELDSPAIDKALSHALKAGIGGGYAPERSAIALGVKDMSLGNVLQDLEEKENREWNKDVKQNTDSK